MKKHSLRIGIVGGLALSALLVLSFVGFSF
jgi:hypothetical protein